MLGWTEADWHDMLLYVVHLVLGKSFDQVYEGFRVA